MPPPKDSTKYEEWRRKNSEWHKGKGFLLKGKHIWTPEQRKKLSESRLGKSLSEETKKRMSNSHMGHIVSEETRIKISNGNKNPSLETLKKMSMAQKGNKNNLGKPLSEETRNKIGKANTGRTHNDDARKKMCEYGLGGFWYGNVRHYDKPQYCELWTPEFRDRVRAFFDYTCPECLTPQNGRKLGVHHIHYDKKTCCKSGEAIGDRTFVPLCRSCHQKTNFNQDFWEQYFTEIIDSYYQGKCYFTPEEMQELKGR